MLEAESINLAFCKFLDFIYRFSLSLNFVPEVCFIRMEKINFQGIKRVIFWIKLNANNKLLYGIFKKSIYIQINIDRFLLISLIYFSRWFISVALHRKLTTSFQTRYTNLRVDDCYSKPDTSLRKNNIGQAWTRAYQLRVQ